MKYQELIQLFASILKCIPHPHIKDAARLLYNCSELLAELITKVSFSFHTTA